MITTDKVKDHIAAVEAAMSKAGKREIAKLSSIRATLLQAVALLDTTPTEENLEQQHTANVAKLSKYHDIKGSIPHDFNRKTSLADLDAHYNPTNLKKSLEFLNYILGKNNDLLCGTLSSASVPA